MKKLKVGILSIIFIFWVASGCKGVTQSEPTWYEVESPTTKDLYSVFAISEDNAWAVGDSGTIIHWDGNSWNLIESSTTKKLNGVHFVDANNGWVVGDSGTILHWNGSVWAGESSPVSVDLNDVQFLSQNDGWAVGDSGVILHCNGEWSIVYQDSISFWKDLYFLSSEDGWIVGCINWTGSEGTGRILHYSKGNWILIDSLIKSVCSVYFLSPTNGWAGLEGKGLLRILHYNGSEWSEFGDAMFTHLSSISFVDRTKGWAVNETGVFLYKENQWRLMEFDNPIHCCLWSVCAVNYNEAWAVGEGGCIIHLQ